MNLGTFTQLCTRTVVVFFILLVAAVSTTPAEAALDPRVENFLRSSEIVQGENNSGDLHLEKEINRAEFMKIVAKVAASKDLSDEYGYCFDDVDEGEWYVPYICWSERHGYVQGYEDYTFRPEQSVTHAEALKIINEVFALDYETYGTFSNKDLWYDIYVNAAVDKNIVDKDIRAKLSQPATREDVFRYLYRAMIIADHNKSRFDDEDIATYHEDYVHGDGDWLYARPLTPNEEELFQILANQIEYGFQPSIETGDASMRFVANIEGNDIDIAIETTEHGTVNGTASKMSGYEGGVEVNARVKVGGVNVNVSFDLSTDIDIAIDNAGILYLRVNKLLVKNFQSDDPFVEQMIDLGYSRVKPYLNNWYKVDLGEISGGEVDASVFTLTANQKAMIEMLVEKAKHELKKVPQFYTITKTETTNEKGKEVYSYKVALYEPALMQGIGVLRNNTSSAYNTYEYKQEYKMIKKYIQDFVNKFSLELQVDKITSMITRMNGGLEYWEIHAPNGEGDFGFSGMVDYRYEYPQTVNIDIPSGAKDLQEVLESL